MRTMAAETSWQEQHAASVKATRAQAEAIYRSLDLNGSFDENVGKIEAAIYDLRRQTVCDYLLAAGPQIR